MPKYRLTWQGTGALDLSQVLDVRGKPVLLTKPGDSVVVDRGTYGHPLVQRYVGSGLKVDEIGTKTPVQAAPAPPPPAPPPAAKTAIEPPSSPKTSAKEVGLTDAVEVDESLAILTSASEDAKEPLEAPEANDEKETPKSKRGNKRSGRSSR